MAVYVESKSSKLNIEVITVSAGTAAAPAIVASGDSDTGCFFPDANTFAVSTAGVQRFRIDSTGRIGTNQLSNFHNLYVNRSATGNTTQIGVGSECIILSDVTSQFVGFRTNPVTSGSFNLTNIYHYQAAQFSALGAGSSVTNIYGFNATASLGGKATNTYGFYSDLASASNTWNLYVNGTAPSLFNGRVFFPAGSQAEPSISISSDTNTGLYAPSADNLAITTGGLERLRVDSGGLIGINTTPTSRRITVRGSSTGDGAVLLQSSSTGTGTSNGFIIQCFGASSDAYLWNFENSPIIIGNDNKERMRIRSDGGVSVGGSGASNVGLYCQPTMTSTSSRFCIYSQPTLAANSTSVAYLVNAGAIVADNATPTTIVGYHVSNASLGTSASVGIQYGYLVPSNFTAGSTNIGFRSAIPDGENRWNIWNDGTAPNYFAGKVLIGAQNASDYNSYSDDLVVHSGGAQSGMTIRGTQYNTIAFADGTGSSNNLRGWVQYLHDDDSLRLGAGGGARIYITSIGRVGISNNNPAYLLDVNGTINTSAGIIVTTGTANSPSYTFNGDSNTGLFAPSADNLAITTGGTERLRVDSSGKILVGTTTSRSAGPAVHPAFQFEGTNAGAASFQCIAGSGQATVSPQILLARHRGGIGDSTLVQDGDTIGIIRFNGGDGTDCVSNAAQIECRIDGTPGSNDMPGRLMFSTTSDGSATATERMRIKSNGVVRFIPLSADPASAEEGDMYFNSTSKKLKVYDGTSWVDLH